MDAKKIFIAASILLAAGQAGGASYDGYYTGTSEASSSYGGYYVDPESKRPMRDNADSFYVGARIDLNFASFENEYSLAGNPAHHGSDSYSFARQLGIDASFGYRFAQKWRAELNYGYTGTYQDADSNTIFDISAQYFMLNGIRTIKEWTDTSIFAGLGAGAGVLKTAFNGSFFSPGADNAKTSAGIVGQAMIGLEEKISDEMSLDLTYKLSYMAGHSQELELLGGADIFKSKTNGIMTNTIGLGVRYSF